MMEMLTKCKDLSSSHWWALVRFCEESLVCPALVYSLTDKEKQCSKGFFMFHPESVTCLRQEVSVTGANTQGENSGR